MKHLIDIYGGMKCLGDIRLVTGETGIRRLGLICDYHDDYPDVFTIYLCTNECEMGADLDYIFHPSETTLPYDIMVQTNLVGTVYRWQFGERIGGITGRMLKTLPELPTIENMYTRDIHGSRTPAGIPCLSSRDPRWRWKCDELDVLNDLTAPFWRDWCRDNPY